MTPIKLSELERLSKEATSGKWTHNDMFESHGLFEVFSAETSTTIAQMLRTKDSRYVIHTQPITISRLCEALRIAHGALCNNEMTDEFYKEFQSKRQPYSYTNWDVKDLIKIKEAVFKINSLVDLS